MTPIEKYKKMKFTTDKILFFENELFPYLKEQGKKDEREFILKQWHKWNTKGMNTFDEWLENLIKKTKS